MNKDPDEETCLAIMMIVARCKLRLKHENGLYVATTLGGFRTEGPTLESAVLKLEQQLNDKGILNGRD